MPAAAAVATIGAGIYGANQQKKAASQAAKAQTQANDASIAEQQRQYDNYQKLVNPYINAGYSALGNQQDLLGLNGYGQQQAALNNIQNSPFLQSAYKQAENAIMQHAAATGGLRGGNIQEALADNRMNMFNTAYKDQLQNLGNIVTTGQNSATNTGTQGMQMAGNIGNLLANKGEAQGGYALAKGQATSGLVNNLTNLGMFAYGKNQGWF